MTAPQPSPSAQPSPPKQGGGSSRRRRKGRRRRSGGAKGQRAKAAADNGQANSGHANSGLANGGLANGGLANGGHANGGHANSGVANSGVANSGRAPKAEASQNPGKPSAKPRKARTQFGSEQKARATLETSAGGIVYRLQGGVPLFLLIRDSYRNWGFPKGHLEHEELPDAAALREVQEETGLLEVTLDGAIETIDWFFRFRGKLVHKVCHFYLMRTEHERTVPQQAEGITACRWAPFHEANRLISYPNARGVLRRANAMLQANDAVDDLLGDPAAGPRRPANGVPVNGLPA